MVVDSDPGADRNIQNRSLTRFARRTGHREPRPFWVQSHAGAGANEPVDFAVGKHKIAHDAGLAVHCWDITGTWANQGGDRDGGGRGDLCWGPPFE